MPKIIEYFGLIFFFWGNEHLPIHVHVQYNEYETKFELLYENGTLSLKKRKIKGIEHLPASKIKEAEKVIQHYHELIIEDWTNFFILHKKVKSIKITKKLN